MYFKDLFRAKIMGNLDYKDWVMYSFSFSCRSFITPDIIGKTVASVPEAHLLHFEFCIVKTIH